MVPCARAVRAGILRKERVAEVRAPPPLLDRASRAIDIPTRSPATVYSPPVVRRSHAESGACALPRGLAPLHCVAGDAGAAPARSRGKFSTLHRNITLGSLCGTPQGRNYWTSLPSRPTYSPIPAVLSMKKKEFNALPHEWENLSRPILVYTHIKTK
ncbi:hypothetical protein EVAR_52432_1 [Eumeta japonica]|uniref:Uncharacterized protein n=1 Tax=Eumeta variegata TaxID=151549 RepID=A0A4C1YBY2_EUMVA|nr:hypothetical protein EVAR_52432_1 [Eumeta japonica]